MNTQFAKIVADVFVDRLKAGVIPWKKPWFFDKFNLQSKRRYGGINRWMLTLRDDMGFLTENQIIKLGGRIKKGQEEKPATIVGYIPPQIVERKVGKKVVVEELSPFAVRVFKVWGDSQFSGIRHTIPAPLELDANVKLEALKRACEIPIVQEHYDEAFCSPTVIVVPRARYFRSSGDYYSTLFHEIGHSLQDREKPLDEDTEELVAELFSSMCLNYCGMEDMDFHIEDSAAYCAQYINLLEQNPRIMMRAAAEAERRFWKLLERFAEGNGELLAA